MEYEEKIEAVADILNKSLSTIVDISVPSEVCSDWCHRIAAEILQSGIFPDPTTLVEYQRNKISELETQLEKIESCVRGIQNERVFKLPNGPWCIGYEVISSYVDKCHTEAEGQRRLEVLRKKYSKK